MKAWHKVLVCGFVAALAGTACTVTSGDGDNDFGDGSVSTGGRTSTGGTSSTGGSDSDGGSTGGTSSGGSGGATGGSGGGGNQDVCDADADPEEGCLGCFQARCTDECNECPDGSACSDELICITACTDAVFDEFEIVEDSDIEACRNMCIGDAGDLAVETYDAIACIRLPLGDSGVESNCGLQCLNMF